MNIADIRLKMQECNLDAYVVTHGNRFHGQDILPSEHKLQQLCGFSGSSGMLLITLKNAYLLVDGRYELQANRETNSQKITIINAVPRLRNACDILDFSTTLNIGYDAWCHTVAEMEYIKRKYKNFHFQDVSWLPNNNCKTITVHERPLQYTGNTAFQKCKIIAQALLEEKADYYLLTAADSVSWLLNIYADDLPYSPVVRAYSLIDKQGRAILIADNCKTSLPLWSWAQFTEYAAQMSEQKILYDIHSAPEKIKTLFAANNHLYKYADLCQLQKAEKNAAELQGMIDCHTADGVALCKFLCWLENNWQGLNEIDVVQKLHNFRAQNDLFISESFATISGCGENAAVVHYQPSKENSASLSANSLLLLDSGGQYLNGTTDVTRTIALGSPTKEMIRDFTVVLQAHIALAAASFPENTSGTKLDTLARAPLWRHGLDYKHGTGHGVACFGNVHEGPISIAATGSDYGFKENMVTSIEPGVYKENLYGIRIENLYYTQRASIPDSNANFLHFCHLTKVPIDKRLVDKYMLTDGELVWLNNYHQDVYTTLAPYMSENEKDWLQKACSPL